MKLVRNLRKLRKSLTLVKKPLRKELLRVKPLLLVKMARRTVKKMVRKTERKTAKMAKKMAKMAKKAKSENQPKKIDLK